MGTRQDRQVSSRIMLGVVVDELFDVDRFGVGDVVLSVDRVGRDEPFLRSTVAHCAGIPAAGDAASDRFWTDTCPSCGGVDVEQFGHERDSTPTGMDSHVPDGVPALDRA